MARLRQAHLKAGLLFKLGPYVDDDGHSFTYKCAIEDHIDGFRRSQNEYWFGRFLREHGKKMLLD